MWQLILLCCILCAVIVIAAIFLLKLNTNPPNLVRLEGEDKFLIPNGNPVTCYDLTQPPTCKVTFVIPAYKETERMKPCLEELKSYLNSKDASFTYEIIVVDDGSNDGTTECALNLSTELQLLDLKVLKLHKNRGKGGAVRMGMLSGSGEYLLMMDADGATDVRDLDKLLKDIPNISTRGHGIAIGSRAHLEEEAIATRSFFRTILMIGFHFAVSFLCVRGIRDTQCGFKLFTRKTANFLFNNLHIERWAFDVELLYIAQQCQIPMKEISVGWQEIDGSKLDPLSSSIQMARDLLRIRLQYMLKLWKIDRTIF